MNELPTCHLSQADAREGTAWSKRFGVLVGRRGQHFVDKASFMGKAFTDAGATALDLPDRHMHEVTLYRFSGSSLFVLASVSYDFRDPGWSIDLSVGDGYPEKAEDPVEFYISAISLAEIGVWSGARELDLDISQKQLRALVSPAIDYCLGFLRGDTSEALEARRSRNISSGSDPLWLKTENSHLKDELESRNEELKRLYAKYV